MKALILAFSNLDDLPANWKDFDQIDVYGQVELSEKEINDLGSTVKVHRQFFEIGNFSNPATPYDICYIRHPDPWGEPRNWLQAISAMVECVKGKLICEFWFPHEIIAFNFLLTSMDESAQIVEAKKLESFGDWKNYSATWTLSKLNKNMLDKYQKNKHKILRQFYTEIGQLHNQDTTLEEIKIELNLK